MVAAVAAILAVLALATGLVAWQVDRSETRLAELKLRQADLERQIITLEQQFPVQEKSPLLEAEVVQLTLARDARTPLLEAVGATAAGGQEGFSPYLEGLARQNPQGVWLRLIRIGEGGRALRLAGSALQPDLAPRFLQRLSAEPVFAGLAFERLHLSRPPTATGHIDFLVDTALEETKD
jgi:hypothetical protein